MKYSAIVVALVLAGCSSGMSVDSANTDSVTIYYAEGNKDAADREANKQCSNYNKRAKFRNVRDESGRKWAIYDCMT